MTKKLTRVLCTILAIVAIVGIQTPFAFAATTTFTDVPAGAWFASSVTAAVNKGYVKGMGDSRFAPYDNLTYAHVFSMLVNAQYEYDERVYESNNFTKVDKGEHVDHIKIYKPLGRAAPVADFIEGMEPKLRNKLVRQIFICPRRRSRS